MSKFFLSNIPVATVQSLRERSRDLLSGSVNSSSFNLSVFYKSSLKDLNYLEIGEGFIAVTGSLLYKNLRGRDLLTCVYNDFIEKGESIRNCFVGNYAVVIKENDRIIIFGEEVYFYDIFYYSKDGLFVVSNDLYDIYQIVDGLEIDEHNLLEKVFLNGVIGNETILKNVFRLSGEQKIVIDLNNSNLDIQTMSIDWSRKNLGFEESVSELSSHLQKVAKAINDTYKTTAICMTGGLDSRMSYASLMSSGNNPTLYYGQGNSQLTNTHSQDYEICKDLSLVFGNKLVKMNWETSNPVDKDWFFYLKKYGLLFQTYAASNNIMTSFEDITENFITFGYLGEMFRTLPFTENRKTFSIRDYVDEYYFQKNDAKKYISMYCIDFNSFRERVIKKYTTVCKKFSLNPMFMKIEDFFYLNLEYRANADSLALNLVNRMRYSILLLSPINIISLANMQVDFLKESHYMLCTLYKMFPNCLNIPIFSHQREMIFLRSSFKLKIKNRKSFKHIMAFFIPEIIKKQLIAALLREGEKNSNINISESLKDSFMNYYFVNDRDHQLSRWEIPLIQHFAAFEKFKHE